MFRKFCGPECIMPPEKGYLIDYASSCNLKHYSASAIFVPDFEITTQYALSFYVFHIVSIGWSHVSLRHIHSGGDSK